MKVTKTEKFIPITLNITLETKKEAEALFNVFNHSDILLASEIDELIQIKDALTKNHYNANGFNYFADNLKLLINK